MAMRARVWDPWEGYERSASGLYLPATAPQVRRKPVGVDLFAGCGGFSLGFHQAGWDVVAALEWSPAPAATYLLNLGAPDTEIHFVTDDDRRRFEKFLRLETKRTGRTLHWGEARARLDDAPDSPAHWQGCRHFWFGDARKVTGQEILATLGMQPGEVDCVFGGPPCQGFSYAGPRARDKAKAVMDPRNSLVFEFCRLVLEIQPKTMVMENVPGLMTMVTPEGIPVIDAICRVLSDGGFGTFDGLKKMLLSTPGAGMAMRGVATARVDEREPGDDEDEDENDDETETRSKPRQATLQI